MLSCRLCVYIVNQISTLSLEVFYSSTGCTSISSCIPDLLYISINNRYRVSQRSIYVILNILPCVVFEFICCNIKLTTYILPIVPEISPNSIFILICFYLHKNRQSYTKGTQDLSSYRNALCDFDGLPRFELVIKGVSNLQNHLVNCASREIS